MTYRNTGKNTKGGSVTVWGGGAKQLVGYERKEYRWDFLFMALAYK